MCGVLVISLDVFGKFANSDFEMFWGGNFVGWVNKSLGGLGENTRDILRQKKKKEKDNIPGVNYLQTPVSVYLPQ